MQFVARAMMVMMIGSAASYFNYEDDCETTCIDLKQPCTIVMIRARDFMHMHTAYAVCKSPCIFFPAHAVCITILIIWARDSI